MKRLLNCTIASALLLSIGHVADDRQARAQEAASSTVTELLAEGGPNRAGPAEIDRLQRGDLSRQHHPPAGRSQLH
jgi:hypothetical protein